MSYNLRQHQRYSKRLGRFLEGKASPGVHDSEGQFTLASGEAFRKLSHRSLEHPEEWILKVVQAGVAGGCERLDLQSTRRGLTIDIHGLAEVPTLGEIEQALFSPELPTSDFLTELVIGLRTCMATATVGLSTGQSESLFWNGSEMGRCQMRNPKSNLRIWLPAKGWSLRAAKDTLEQLELLKRRALYAPLELRVDSGGASSGSATKTVMYPPGP